MEKEKKLKQVKICIIVAVSIIVIPSLLIGIVMLKQNIDEKKKQEQLAIEESNKVIIPNLIGMTYKEAKDKVEKLELKYVIYPWKVPYDDDLISSQDPPAETKVQKGTQIKIGIKTSLVEQADTFTGMQFRISKEDYEKKFLENYTDSIKYGFADESFKYVEKDTFSETVSKTVSKYVHFIYYGVPKNVYLSTTVGVDDSTNNVVFVQCSYYTSLSEDRQSTAISFMLKAMKTLSLQEDYTIQNIFEDMVNNNETRRFKDGIVYSVGTLQGGIMSFRVTASNEEMQQYIGTGKEYKSSVSTSNQESSNEQRDENTIRSNSSSNLEQYKNTSQEQTVKYVNVTAYVTDSSKKYKYAGRTIKITFEKGNSERMNFDGQNYTSTFALSNTDLEKATIQVYIDDELMKTQEVDMKSLLEKARNNNETTVKIDIPF